MVHTLPDYTTKYKLAKIFSTVDVAELAARLDSIVSFDRRGNVFLLDDMEHGLVKWNGTGTGGRGSVTNVNTGGLSGSHCLAIATGNQLNDVYQLDKYWPNIDATSIGCEFSFSSGAHTGIVDMTIYGFTGTTRYQGTILINCNTGTLQYKNSAGVYTTVATGLSFWDSSLTWYTIKLVIDRSTNKYVRFLINDDTYDLSSQDLYSAASVVPERLWLSITIYTLIAGVTTYNIDNIIYTRNED